ncbi:MULTISPECIES: valine--tRNA ligase [unclassified Candidatus Frackibacter]|uniref:valine--tRNA ligase n=1 Tax=unclassified Candidatus Frackibacter TaxID=2648818 RepID=UPI00088AD823|nr:MULTISPECIES: valine--tRNA ligase [unclassified Candidatus Frackibacter]SDC76209.1 valyl-tRNA synthetase [Candidatus Frackibacter sp. WG11]SEM89699.1 valyl-tRNA synthetase [Candidatus Frackibacter sp. WG12]SFL99182.1 valyl-tRNA synthetase [Candidatus Frackibacter sp. WG13]
MTQEKMATTYDPATVEDKWYEFWMENDYFEADVDQEKESFSIVMPPPNVTGQLHIGHALDNTLQDILTRWKRMQGYTTLWVPGTDHASIATEVKVVNKMRDEEGLEKDDVGREGFLERAWEWKEEYGGRIIDQLKKLGTSCDWGRERFTMDEGCSKAVREAFIQLYEKDLIYRGDYIINWCPDCGTTLSDIEVEHMEIPGHFYHIKYQIKDSDEEIVVATTRPETMLGDTAIAVNPSDERYQDLIGKTVILPIVGREIPVVADEYVDSEFGTGLVKVTPAHDPNDFEIGQRHDLEVIKVIDDNAIMTAKAGKYEGMDRYECREELVNDLDASGQLVEKEEHDHSVGHCYRCDTVIEPLVSKQWFVKMEPLAKPAIEAVKESETNFVPERFTKVYLNWMENIRDWCISRQLWWGHRIPVWYCQDCEEEIVAREEPTECSECGSEDLKQDEDVLDTWFSSGLWPFSTLGWPEETDELGLYYPTSVLVTGRDIIFFWVARMIFSGMEFMEEAPFADVYVHGLVRDAQGRKMSKSLGNGVDPLEFIDEYGADTLRFTLITGNTPGNDMRFRQEKVEASRNFVNKIWNASRFVLMNLEDFDPNEVEELDYTLADKWIMSRVNKVSQEVTDALDKYQLGNAAQMLYDFIWNEFCDWYIELIKPRLYQDEDQTAKETAQYVVWSTLEQTLRLLHPFMPFITEEIWQRLSHEGETVMLSQWPEGDADLINDDAEEKMAVIMDVIRAIRNIRNEMKVNPGREITAILQPKSEEKVEIIAAGQDYIVDLGKISDLTVEQELDEKPEKASTAITNGVEVILPLEGMVDLDKEIARLEDEIEEMEFEINRAEGKLANEGFVNNAPEELVEEEKQKAKEYKDKKEQLIERLEMLKL